MNNNSEKHYGSDRTRRSCPHGAAVTYPVGTVKHVKVGDMDCAQCPCYNGLDENTIGLGSTKAATMCCYPDFAPNSRMKTMDMKQDPKTESSGTVAKEG